MQPVLTKRDFVERFQTGEFGNKGPVWNTLDEFRYNKRSGLFHLRNRVAGGSTYYNLSWAALINRWIEQSSLDNWYAASMAPHDLNLFQGEVVETDQGIALYGSTEVGLPMRDALVKSGKQWYGLEAVGRLRAYLCPNSYEWLGVLLERYEGHVVEFSAFSSNWGDVPGYNTVIWEVRSY